MNYPNICPSCLFQLDEKNVHDGLYHCPRCGGSFRFGNKVSDEINEGYRQLSNLNFENAYDIAEKLTTADPANAEAWFLTVLASNRVCYCENDNKEIWPYDMIPTLNDILFSDIRKSEYAVKALKYAQTAEQTARFTEVFNYLEKVREKAADAIKCGEYDCDVFISVKVSAVDPETKKLIRDADGHPYKTKDYEYARDLHDEIVKKHPGCKVFLSELMKTELVGKEYEPIIYAALRSAKVMILVGSSDFNIRWPWVRNEWKRYLYWKDHLSDGKKRNFVFMALNQGIGYPQAFRDIQAITATDLHASERLFLFLDNVLTETDGRMLAGRSFGEEVARTIDTAVSSEIGKKALRRYVADKNSPTDRKIASVIYDLEASASEEDSAARRRKRKNCFDELRRIVASGGETHRAELYLLLEGSDSTDFKRFFFDKNVSQDTRKKFFDLADQSEAIEVIDHVVNVLTSDGGKKADLFTAPEAFTAAIAPHFDYIAGDGSDRLSKLSECMSARVAEELSNIRKEYASPDDLSLDHEKRSGAVLAYARCYLWLRQYLSDNDPVQYVEARTRLLKEFDGILSNDVFVEEIRKICDEIEKVQKGNPYALWYGMEPDMFFYIASPGKLLSECDSPDDSVRYDRFEEMLAEDRGVVVHNKQVIDTFRDLFRYAPAQSDDGFDKKTILLLFLELIVHDEAAYEKSGDGGIEPSTGTNDEDLNGYDLFLKYVEYDLGEKTMRATFKTDFRDEFVLQPSIAVSALKKNRKPVDMVLADFAVSLQEYGLFENAVSVYKLYLGQQGSAAGADCLLVKFYMILCGNKCRNLKEQENSPSQTDVREIKEDIVVLLDSTSADERDRLRKLHRTLSDFADRQSEFADEAKLIGSWIDSLPPCNVANSEIYSSTVEKIHDRLCRKAEGSAFDRNVAERLEDLYREEMRKLDGNVAQLKKVNALLRKIFENGNSGREVWESVSRSGEYPRADLEKDLDFLLLNKSILDPAKSRVRGELQYLQKMCMKQTAAGKRKYEKSLAKRVAAKKKEAKREERRYAREQAAEVASDVFGVVFKIFLLLLSTALNVFAGYCGSTLRNSEKGAGAWLASGNAFVYIFVGVAVLNAALFFIFLVAEDKLEDGYYGFLRIYHSIIAILPYASCTLVTECGCRACDGNCAEGIMGLVSLIVLCIDITFVALAIADLKDRICDICDR